MKLRVLILTGVLLLLTACGAANVPVINKSPNRYIPPEVVVGSKDSIYSISWRYGLDYLDIAEWNGLMAPYDLKSGQKISLRAGAKPTPVEPPAKVASQPIPPPATVKPAPGPPADVADKPADKPAPVPAAPAKPLPPLSEPTQWQWPAQGEVLARYSPDNGNNGLQIGGNPGAPVTATAAGDVVYVGEGLRGYGKLIILKHTDKFLSAYAHNQRILVAEGDRVKSTQKIAEMGSSGAERTMLHFEIRVNGKPEDPLKYLK